MTREVRMLYNDGKAECCREGDGDVNDGKAEYFIEGEGDVNEGKAQCSLGENSINSGVIAR
jgi:hypothetical protein